MDRRPRGASEQVSFRSSGWRDYALLDSGDGRKLERFGAYTLIRPEPLATWRPALPRKEWDVAHAAFEPTGKAGQGRWAFRSPVESPWQMRYRALCFRVELTASRHVGVFPEHAVHWDWIREHARRIVDTRYALGPAAGERVEEWEIGRLRPEAQPEGLDGWKVG